MAALQRWQRHRWKRPGDKRQPICGDRKTQFGWVVHALNSSPARPRTRSAEAERIARSAWRTPPGLFFIPHDEENHSAACFSTLPLHHQVATLSTGRCCPPRRWRRLHRTDPQAGREAAIGRLAAGNESVVAVLGCESDSRDLIRRGFRPRPRRRRRSDVDLADVFGQVRRHLVGHQGRDAAQPLSAGA